MSDTVGWRYFLSVTDVIILITKDDVILSITEDDVILQITEDDVINYTHIHVSIYRMRKAWLLYSSHIRKRCHVLVNIKSIGFAIGKVILYYSVFGWLKDSVVLISHSKTN